MLRENTIYSYIKTNRKVYGLLKSAWLFPSLLFILLILLTAFKVSGTSVGIYYPILYGANHRDPNLLYGHPQPIRSDEWLYVTQMTVAQHAAGWPRINHNIEYGRDMSVVGDAPYKEWSAAFKPQNLVFFLLPLQYAFAFKWWLLLFLVIVSCYFFILRFFSDKRLLAAIVSSAVGLSPFLAWWYQTMTLAPLFYGFFILIIGMRIINGERIRWLKKYNKYSWFVYTVILAYLLTAFALILYPPFQIPIVLCVVVFLVGYILDRYRVRNLLSRDILSKVSIFVVSLALAGGVVAFFIHTRSEAVYAITHTVYPGAREIPGGHTPTFEVFSSYLQPQLERTLRGAHYYTNQSEASSFMLFLPFLLLPGFLLVFIEYKQKHKLNWTLIMVQLLGCLFLANLFLAWLQPMYKLLFLDRVPHDRLFLGLGFVGILQLTLIMKSLARANIRKFRLNLTASLYTLACLAVLVWAGSYIRQHYPLFIHSIWLIGFFAVFFASIIYCFLSRKLILGAALFFLLSFGCVYKVHPLYRGLAPIYPSQLNYAIDLNSKPGDTWIALDNIYFENAAIMANRNSLSGIQLYPDVNFWSQVDGPKDDYIYNRYAHVLFNSDSALQDRLRLTQLDTFQVKFECSSFILQHVQYVLSTHPVDNMCVTLTDQVSYPGLKLYIYHIE